MEQDYTGNIVAETDDGKIGAISSIGNAVTTLVLRNSVLMAEKKIDKKPYLSDIRLASRWTDYM